jgi:hypothetical protein
MKYHIILLLVLLIALVFYCHVYQYMKKSNHYEILQVSNPTPDNLEKTFLDKLPVIITDMYEQWDGFNQIDSEYMKVQPDLTKDKIAIKLLDKYTRNMYLPFSIGHSYNSNVCKTEEKTQLKKVEGHRHLIVQMQGKMRYILFYPEQSKNIYDGSVDFWNWRNLSEEEKKKFPLFPKAAYIELILSKGKILHLPKDWWYASQAMEDTIQMTIDSKSIFSVLVK